MATLSIKEKMTINCHGARKKEKRRRNCKHEQLSHDNDGKSWAQARDNCT